MDKQTSRGRFITLEGSEGMGKSTQITAIKSFLASQGIETIFTREPGGTPVAEALRDIVKAKHAEKLTAEAELLIIFAARAQHIAQVIEPALARGAWVVSDRFTDATYAYQGGGRGFSQEQISLLERWVQKGLKPDLTLLLDAPVEVGLSRAKGRGELDRFEKEDILFFERVRSGYLDRASAFPDQFRVIDATRTPEDVTEYIHAALIEKFQLVTSNV